MHLEATGPGELDCPFYYFPELNNLIAIINYINDIPIKIKIIKSR